MTIAAHDITTSDVQTSIAVARSHGEKFFEQIVWQVENETWSLLGYHSWDDMRQAEYGDLGVVAPRADRPELVARLRAKGLTQKEVAGTLGIGQATVARHDEPTYRPRESNIQTDIEPAEDFITDQADLDAAPDLPDEGVSSPYDSGEAEPSEAAGSQSPPARPVTGLDGKQYARSEPRKQERPEHAMSASEADQDRQQQEARALARALVTLSAFEHQQARQRYRESWAAQPYSRGLGEPYYKPSTIRQIAASLTTFATELEEA